MISVRVPATSANLGPGFDCLGLAVSLYLEVRLSFSDKDSFLYSGQDHLENTPNNLIHKGFRMAYRKAAKVAPKVSLEVYNPIPLARGLGSSSAALVAGIALADKLLDHELDREGVFQLSAELEGHPDNVAPAVYGNFTVSALQDDGKYLSQSLVIPRAWQFIFAVPDFKLLTSEARAVLPEDYKRQDVVFNSSRSALWATAVALNRPELLSVASQDRLHEPYREPLIAGMQSCRKRLRQVGATACYLSGAGPTLTALSLDAATTERCKRVMKAFVGPKGQILTLEPSEGYTLATFDD